MVREDGHHALPGLTKVWRSKSVCLTRRPRCMIFMHGRSARYEPFEQLTATRCISNYGMHEKKPRHRGALFQSIAESERDRGCQMRAFYFALLLHSSGRRKTFRASLRSRYVCSCHPYICPFFCTTHLPCDKAAIEQTAKHELHVPGGV